MKEITKIKPITLTDTDNGDVFVLEFTRDSVKFAEQRGFNLDDLDKYPMTKVPELFFYSFRAHHPSVSREKTDKILFEKLGGMHKGMLGRLAELYSEPFTALMHHDEEEGNEEKNVKMTVEL